MAVKTLADLARSFLYHDENRKHALAEMKKAKDAWDAASECEIQAMHFDVAARADFRIAVEAKLGQSIQTDDLHKLAYNAIDGKPLS